MPIAFIAGQAASRPDLDVDVIDPAGVPTKDNPSYPAAAAEALMDQVSRWARIPRDARTTTPYTT